MVSARHLGGFEKIEGVQKVILTFFRGVQKVILTCILALIPNLLGVAEDKKTKMYGKWCKYVWRCTTIGAVEDSFNIGLEHNQNIFYVTNLSSLSL